jgi:3-methyl-2-oxobutanoate hydroxymethyltransferase
MQKITTKNILNRKNKTPITCLTAYSKITAQIADRYCDITLVGDSLGMTLYGMKNTKYVNIETMILHAKTVKKFSKKSLIVVDMPYKTYTNKHLAYKNAKKIINSTKCDAVKLEGGVKVAKIIKYLTTKGIKVMGHIGLLPQSSAKLKFKGANKTQYKKILEDAMVISRVGVFAIVIECVVEKLAKEITKRILVPTIGIGASKHCDGQILVIDDMLGISGFKPKFVKQYSNIKRSIEKCVKSYTEDVKLRRFPTSKNIYN